MTTWTTIAVLALVTTSGPLVASTWATSLLEVLEGAGGLPAILGLGGLGLGGLVVWVVKRYVDAHIHRRREHADADIEIKRATARQRRAAARIDEAKARRIDAGTEIMRGKPTKGRRGGKAPDELAPRRRRKPGGGEPPSGPA